MDRRRVYLKNYRNPKVFSTRNRKIRDRRRSGLLKKALRVFILIVVLLGINFLLSSDYFEIKNINIKGDMNFAEKVKELTKAELGKNRFLLFKNNNFFLFDGSKLKSLAEDEVKEIKSLGISRNFPSSIEISIKEKKAKLGWETEGKRFLIDDEGYILKEAEAFDGLLIVKDISNLPVSLDKKVVYPSFINFVENLSNKLGELNITSEYIEVKETTFIINIATKEGFRLVFDTTKGLNDQIAKLEETLKQVGEQKNNLEYIDLTVKNKAIYKFKYR